MEGGDVDWICISKWTVPLTDSKHHKRLWLDGEISSAVTCYRSSADTRTQRISPPVFDQVKHVFIESNFFSIRFCLKIMKKLNILKRNQTFSPVCFVGELIFFSVSGPGACVEGCIWPERSREPPCDHTHMQQPCTCRWTLQRQKIHKMQIVMLQTLNELKT